MDDFEDIYKAMELLRKDNQVFSFPFVVKLQSGEAVVVWFGYKVVGTSQRNLFTRINAIYCVGEDREPVKIAVAIDLLFLFSEKPISRYRDYFQKLDEVFRSYDREKMDALLEDKADQPLFDVYHMVENYMYETVKDYKEVGNSNTIPIVDVNQYIS